MRNPGPRQGPISAITGRGNPIAKKRNIPQTPLFPMAGLMAIIAMNGEY